jgi:RNA-directed DNA polymerase
MRLNKDPLSWRWILQKHLLIIHDHSTKYPNAGSLLRALIDYEKRLFGLKKCNEPLPLISIVTDIAYHNQRTYSICAAILSKLLNFLQGKKDKQALVKKIKRKFSQISNTGHMEIWLQRISSPFAPNIAFDEPLCRLVCGENAPIWNSDWISSDDLRNAVDAKRMVNHEKVKELDPVVPPEEVRLFIAKAGAYQ